MESYVNGYYFLAKHFMQKQCFIRLLSTRPRMTANTAHSVFTDSALFGYTVYTAELLLNPIKMRCTLTRFNADGFTRLREGETDVCVIYKQ